MKTNFMKSNFVVLGVCLLISGYVGYRVGIYSHKGINDDAHVVSKTELSDESNKSKIENTELTATDPNDECAKTHYIDSMTPEDERTFVTPSKLTWKRGLPDDLSLKSVLSAYGDSEDPNIDYKLAFNHAYVDLIGDDEKEVIVHNEIMSGSGGRSYTIYKKVNKQWKSIGEFFGGFYANKSDKKFNELVVYMRNGIHYMRSIMTYDLKKNAYKETSFIDLPDEGNKQSLWCYFLSLNGYTSEADK